MARLRDVCVDATDAWALAEFWNAVLSSHQCRSMEVLRSWAAEDGIDVAELESVPLDPVGSGGTRIWFNTVPEPRAGKNRLHLDVDLGDDGELDRLLALGATVVSRPEDHGERWWVLADPDGNHFCAFPPS